jgi:hypothetical protein
MESHTARTEELARGSWRMPPQEPCSVSGHLLNELRLDRCGGRAPPEPGAT